MQLGEMNGSILTFRFDLAALDIKNLATVEVDKVAISVLPQLVFIVVVLLLLPDTDLGAVLGGSTLNIKHTLVELQMMFAWHCLITLDVANNIPTLPLKQ